MEGNCWRRVYLCGVLVYSLFFIAYTYPLIFHFPDGFLGEGDAHIFTFNAYNFSHQLSSGESFFKTEVIFAPRESSLLFHTSTFILSAFASIFGTDSYLGFNIYLLLSFLVSGLGAMRLARYYNLTPQYALLSGLIFAFSSYKATKLGFHYNLVLTEFVPFFVYQYLVIKDKTSDFKNWKFFTFIDVVKLFGWFVLCVFSDYIVTIIALYFIALNALYFLVLNRVVWTKKVKWLVGVSSVVVIVGIDQLSQLLKRDGVSDGDAFWYSGDLISFFIPFNSFFYPFESLKSWHQEIIGNSYSSETNLFLGYTLILLVILLVVLRKGIVFSVKQKSLLFCIVMFVLIALPSFKVCGVRLFYGPTSLQHFVPLLNNMRVPTRVISMLIFLISMVVFGSLSFKIKLFQKKWVTVLIAVFLFIDYFPIPKKLNLKSEFPEVYNALRQNSGETLLVVPFGVSDGRRSLGHFDLWQLSYLSSHQKKLYGGFLARAEDELFKQVGDNSFLVQLIALQNQVADFDKHTIEISDNELSDFQDLGIDNLLVTKEYLNSAAHLYIEKIASGYHQKTEVGGVIYCTEE